MAQPIQTRIYADNYFQLPAYDTHDFIQLIDGEVIIGMPPRTKHQDIVRELLVMFTLIARQTGGKAYHSPIEVYLDEHNIYEPDVLYLTPDSQCQIGEMRLTGAPELVVEVLSPSTAKFDKGVKYLAYEQHGVHEYWIVDPVHEIVQVWLLNDMGAFKLQGAFGINDQFDSVTLGETISVKDIFSI